MADTLKASKEGLAIIDEARKRKGWNKSGTSAWWEAAQSSQATLKRFWLKKPVSREAFIGICQAVGEDWQKIVEPNLIECKTFLLPKNLPLIKNWVEGSRSKELENLRATILDSETRTITITAVCVVGLAGIGKTTLANQLIRKLQSENVPFTASSWQSLRSITGKLPRFDSVMDSVLLELSNGEIHPLVTILDDYRQKTERLIEILKSKKCLLVFDNVETILKIRQLKRAGFFLEECTEYAWLFEQVANLEHKSKVIFTSRETLALIPGAEFKLKGLDQKSAIQLLKSFNLIASPNDLEELVHKYNGHPKALEVVSAIILDNEFQGCVSKFLEDRKWLLVNTLDELLDQAIERLSDEELQCLSRISVYETTEYKLQSSGIIAQLPQVSERDIKENIIEALKRRQLLDFDSNKESYQMHPLVQEKASKMLDSHSRIKAHRQAYSHFSSIAKPQSEWLDLSDIKPLLRAYYHAYQAQDLDQAAYIVIQLENFLEKHYQLELLVDLCESLLGTKEGKWEEETIITSSNYQASILYILGKTYHHLKNYKTSIIYLEACLKIRSRVSCKEQESEALYYIGVNYMSFKPLKAIEHFNSSLLISEQLDKKLYVKGLQAKGSTFKVMGDYTQAKECFDYALRISRKIRYEEGKSGCYCDLADVASLSQDYNTAIQYRQKALRLAKKNSNLKQQEYALYGLADDFNKLGKHEAALTFAQDCIKISRDILDIHIKGCAIKQIGIAYREMHNYENSINFLSEYLNISRQIGNRFHEADALYHLGLTLRKSSKDSLATECLRKSLDIYCELNSCADQDKVLVEISRINAMCD